jgi:hypothetical protein
MVHWYVGWSLVLAGLLVGSGLGLFFHREGFLGGYGSFRRRLVRLGHIALIALGLVNVLLSLGHALPAESHPAWPASWLIVIGSLSMPALCFLTAWQPRLRYGFCIPVVSLASAVFLLLMGGPP